MRIREHAIGALQIFDGPQFVAANMRLTDQGLAIGADALAFDDHIGEFAPAILLENALAFIALGLRQPHALAPVVAERVPLTVELMHPERTRAL